MVPSLGRSSLYKKPGKASNKEEANKERFSTTSASVPAPRLSPVLDEFLLCFSQRWTGIWTCKSNKLFPSQLALSPGVYHSNRNRNWDTYSSSSEREKSSHPAYLQELSGHYQPSRTTLAQHLPRSVCSPAKKHKTLFYLNFFFLC